MPSVYISPSTQERNFGVGGYGSEEAQMNAIADLLVPELERHGLTVYRNHPRMTLKEVIRDSNAKKPDAHVAIHSNAGGGKGTEIWILARGGRAEKLAEAIYKHVAPLSPGKDRGIKESRYFGELSDTVAPAVIVELGFHDDPQEAKWIMSSRIAIAFALARGICEFFGIKYCPREPESKAEPAPQAGRSAGTSSADAPTAGGQASVVLVPNAPMSNRSGELWFGDGYAGRGIYVRDDDGWHLVWLKPKE
ncbi:MAG: N-acetylmuramoyl-L-alanine amidase [Clostridia bacterium]|nr:N-acetylmuramoyl-L-alanine amidase [Clostridia bacterium]